MKTLVRCNLVTLVTLLTLSAAFATDNVVDVNVAPKADRSKPATLATKDLSGVHIPKVTVVDQSGNPVSSGTGGDASAANQTTQITAEQAIQSTLGAKTDAKSTATDATSVSAMQVLKQISASVQAPPSQAVTGTFWQATQPVSGTFWQATQPVSGTFWQATQSVSAASLPLPTGAATSANQWVGTGTVVSSTALEASHVIRNSAGTLVSLVGYNSKTSAQFIQLFNSTTVPADTTVPILTFIVPATCNFSYDIPIGLTFATGIAVSNSSTAATKTIGSADCFFTAVHHP